MCTRYLPYSANNYVVTSISFQILIYDLTEAHINSGNEKMLRYLVTEINK